MLKICKLIKKIAINFEFANSCAFIVKKKYYQRKKKLHVRVLQSIFY